MALVGAKVQQVVRVEGIDKSGSTESYRPSDVHNLHQLLNERGLQYDDGFYALPFQWMAEPSPIDLTRYFLNGTHSLAIFDGSQLIIDEGTDYVIFKQPQKKKEALLGIITPTK